MNGISHLQALYVDSTWRHGITAAVSVFIVSIGILIGGWSLFEFDRALVTYALALVASLTLTTYRFTVWLHRPPTWLLYRRAMEMLVRSPNRIALCKHLARRVVGYFALNRFVFRRGRLRWLAHWPIMSGCSLAFAIVVPLIFGWIWFETAPNDLHSYQVMLFGKHVRTLSVDSIEAFLVFHGLVWASVPVLLGCIVAVGRRLRDRGEQATQSFANDFAPLIALLAITLTGLLMTLSYSLLGGALHAPLALAHLIIVCVTLLWLPYSKLFHIPQRSLKLAHMIYEFEAAAKNIECARCGNEFATAQQVSDLIEVQQRLGYRYELPSIAHYQQICPRCRRSTLVVAHSQRWRGIRTMEATFHGP